MGAKKLPQPKKESVSHYLRCLYLVVKPSRHHHRNFVWFKSRLCSSHRHHLLSSSCHPDTTHNSLWRLITFIYDLQSTPHRSVPPLPVHVANKQHLTTLLFNAINNSKSEWSLEESTNIYIYELTLCAGFTNRGDRGKRISTHIHPHAAPSPKPVQGHLCCAGLPIQGPLLRTLIHQHAGLLGAETALPRLPPLKPFAQPYLLLRGHGHNFNHKPDLANPFVVL